MSMLRNSGNSPSRATSIDLAVGVIIGAAFGKIVDSLVNDLIMPVIGKFTGGLDFASYYIALGPVPAGLPHTLEAMRKAGVPVIAWGNFLNIVINFVILAFIVFLMVKQINRLRAPAPAGARRPARGRRAAARDPRRARAKIGGDAQALAPLRPGGHAHARGALRREPGEARLARLARPGGRGARGRLPARGRCRPPGASRLSFSEAARKAIPSVVNISATRQVKRAQPAARGSGVPALLRRPLQPAAGDAAVAGLGRDREPRGLHPHQRPRGRGRDRHPGDARRRRAW